MSCVAFGTAAYAQAVDPSTLVAELAPGAAGPMVTTLKSQNALAIEPTSQIPTAFDFPATDVAVGFDGASHLLTADGMIALRSVALALQDDRLTNQSFQVAGHFVSENDPNSAVRVSARRAQAVAEHLVVYYGITPDRLVPVGYGATALVDPTVIASPSNNRIQFINILLQ